MYKLNKGWSKAKMKKVIRSRNTGEKSTMNGSSNGCVYFSMDSKGRENSCAVGCFIPKKFKPLFLRDEPGFVNTASVYDLFKHSPQLADKMPLDVHGMAILQNIHDSTINRQSARKRMLKWIDENVE